MIREERIQLGLLGVGVGGVGGGRDDDRFRLKKTSFTALTLGFFGGNNMNKDCTHYH